MTPELQNISDAVVIINRVRKEVLDGPDYPWRVLKHASDYLEKQIAAYFKEVA